MKMAVQLIRKPKGGELDGYLFVDAKHVRDWMSQPFVNDKGYGVRAVRFKIRGCCQEPYAFKTIKEWETIKEALADKLERYYTNAT